VNYKLSLETEVGGLGIKLFGSSVSKFDVVFNKNTFYPGEKIAVKITCDNSSCKTAVKSYKMKLFRQLRHREGVTGHFEDYTELVTAMKSPGCDAKKKDTREIELEIPMHEKEVDESKHWAPLNAIVMKNGVGTRINYANNAEYNVTFKGLTGSWLGVVYQVQYILKVYVKHAGTFSFGAGKCVSLPVKILNYPAITTTTEPYRVPEIWSPNPGNADTAYLNCAESYRSKYFTDVLQKHWALWEKKEKPVLSNEEDKKGEDFSTKAARRKSIKMNYDEAEEEKYQDNYAQDGYGEVEQSYAEQMFSAGPGGANQQQQEPQAQGFYEQMMNGGGDLVATRGATVYNPDQHDQ